MTNSAQPVMEPYSRHVLVCTGDFCSPDRRGRRIYSLLAELLQREDLLFGPTRVKRGETPPGERQAVTIGLPRSIMAVQAFLRALPNSFLFDFCAATGMGRAFLDRPTGRLQWHKTQTRMKTGTRALMRKTHRAATRATLAPAAVALAALAAPEAVSDEAQAAVTTGAVAPEVAPTVAGSVAALIVQAIAAE